MFEFRSEERERGLGRGLEREKEGLGKEREQKLCIPHAPFSPPSIEFDLSGGRRKKREREREREREETRSSSCISNEAANCRTLSLSLPSFVSA